jgi:polyhydroxyalkanoate synthesis regulator phasin
VKPLATVLCLALSAGAYAQEKKPLTAEQKLQQQRINDCRAKAGNRKGDERKIFMSSCLKQATAAHSEAQKKQQERMSACTRQASEKKLSGDARRSFMSSCLKS